MVSNTQRTRPPKHLCQCYSTQTFTANCRRISPSAFIDVQSPQMFCRKSIHIFPENIIFLKNFSQTANWVPVSEISVIDFPISIHGYVNSREYTSPMARLFFFVLLENDVSPSMHVVKTCMLSPKVNPLKYPSYEKM